MPSIDLKVLHELDQLGDPNLVSELIVLFLDLLPTALQKIQHSIHEGQLTETARTAHSLKSSALNLGARVLGKLCADLELSAIQNKVDSLSNLFEELSVESSNVVLELTQMQTQKAA